MTLKQFLQRSYTAYHAVENAGKMLEEAGFRKVTAEEYKEVEEYLFASGIEDGFVQEEDAASGEFIPCFDGTGV